MERFTSRLTTVLTMVGVAVGLGNVWRFPYMMGSHGGSAFLFVYLFFVVVFGIPAVMGEWALGRETRGGPVQAFAQAWGRAGRAIGALLVVNVVVANSYYLVVIAGIVYSAGFSVIRGFGEETHAAYASGLSSFPLQAALSLALLALCLLVLRRGLVRGIEKVSRIFVPLFGLVVLVLILHAMTLPGAMRLTGEFLRPDFSGLGAREIFAAMGQAIFSLSLGGTFFLAYGSSLREEESLGPPAILTALGDVGSSLLAALFLVPAILVYGLDLASGPDLVFQTFPRLFAEMPLGRVAGSLFLLVLGLVAFLSAVAALHVARQALVALGVGPTRALLLLGIAESVLLLPSAHDGRIIGILDLYCGSGMQCLGCGLALLALTWGVGKARVLQQLGPSGKGARGRFLFFWLRWGVPSGLFAVLVLYVLQKSGMLGD